MEENKRKSIILMAIGVLTLLIVVGGATYAYFQAQIDKGASSNVDITTNITDSLTFQTNDLEVKLDKVDDNDTKNELVIKATQDNFGEGNNSIGDGVNAIAHLIAGGEDYQAEYNYYLYLNITKNELQYSSYKNESETKYFKTEEEKTPEAIDGYTPIPELYLTIKKNGVEVTEGVTIGENALSYKEDIFTETGKEPESKVGGFDITEAKGLIKIKVPETISVTKETKNHTAEDNWEIIITFVNLETDQYLNAGKSINGEVLILSEKPTLAMICKDTEFASCIADNYELDSFLIKHDGKQDNENEENYALEAEDNSIRYTGSNAKINEKLTSKIVKDLYDNDKLIMGIMYWYKDDENASDIIKCMELSEKYEINQEGVPTSEELSFLEEFEQKIENGEILVFDTKEDAIADAKEKGKLQEENVDNNFDEVFDSYAAGYNLYWLKTDENAEAIRQGIELFEQLMSGEKQFESVTSEEQKLIQQVQIFATYGAHSEAAAVQDAVKEGLTSKYEGIEYLKNYICLDNKTTGDCASNEDLYRIIGLFKNNEGNYEMKLIKASAGTTKELGDETAKISEEDPIPSAYGIEENRTGYYWNSTNGRNVNMWAESNLNKVNLNSYFYNYITTRAPYLKEHITKHTWTTGGFLSTSTYEVEGNAKEIYNYELGVNKVKVNDNVCYTQGDTSTKRACTEKDIEHQAHIGLMYVSDYIYAATSSSWATAVADYTLNYVKNNNWIYLGLGNEWLISRNSKSANDAYAFFVYSLSSSDVSCNLFDIRPVFYLDISAKLKEGEGTPTNPYRITFE